MSTTESTVVNFSIREFLARVKRIDTIHESQHNLQDDITFPRAQRAILKSPEGSVFYPVLPEDYEIEAVVLKSFQRAAKKAIFLE